MSTLPTPINRSPGPRTVGLAVFAALAAAVGLAYAPNFAGLIYDWEHNASYSHGFLIIPIALYILWQRRERLPKFDPMVIRPAGWLLLAICLGVRAYFYEINQLWFETTTLLGTLAALTMIFGGFRLLLWSLPGLFFLVFMFPLPPSVNGFLAGPLQSLATQGSALLLQAGGLPVLTVGNVLIFGPNELEVAQACNGLSMLQTFVALIVAVTLLTDRPIWEKAVLLISVVPIALLSNILRIAATVWCYHWFGPQAKVFGWTIEDLGHDAAGWAMMPIALVFVWLELKIMAWLIIEEEAPSTMARSILSPLPSGGIVSSKSAGAGAGQSKPSLPAEFDPR